MQFEESPTLAQRRERDYAQERVDFAENLGRTVPDSQEHGNHTSDAIWCAQAA
jgi:hypothetical protein